jgi:uncharacterized protein
MKKRVSLIFGTVAFIYLLVCFSLRIWHNRLIFFPDLVIKNTPRDLDLQYEEVRIPLNGDTLYGWWIPTNNNVNGKTRDKVLIYLHGNSTNISGSNLRHAERFQRLGFSVLSIDYRGYGKSTGNFPTEASVYQDAQTAWDYLTKERKVKAENIFIYGHSLGGAIAIELAVNNPQAAGTIVEGTFTSIRQMAEYKKIYNFLPLNLIVTHQFDSLSKISRLQTPLLVIHGTDDRTVPSFMGEVLYNKAKEPKQFWSIASGGHNNLADFTGEEYLKKIRNFVELTSKQKY